MKECDNCHRTIGDLETPRAFGQYIVCAECKARLQFASATPTSTPNLATVGAAPSVSESITPYPVSRPELASASRPSTTKSIRQVSGWLRFFCWCLTIISPALWIIYIVENFVVQPVHLLPSTVKTAVLLEAIVYTLIMGYGIKTGVSIWVGSPNGKKLAERYLVIRVLALCGVDVGAAVMLRSDPALATPALLEAIDFGLWLVVVRETIIFGVWFLYFQGSKRVRDTYVVPA